LAVACLGAVPWTAHEQAESAEQRSGAWSECADLAQSDSILELLDGELTKLGVVGERRGSKLLYLALTSRLLDRPVSVVVKGPSSGGKSYVTESVLKLFPPSAFYALTAMSDRALAYSNEPLKHRHLVIYEAAGMTGDFATYLIRSLLSEGRLRYETVEKTKDGLQPKVIEREGPTGLLVTTTALRLHPENETRRLSLTVTDTPEQTAHVFQALAAGFRDDVDLTPWHALQNWLATGSTSVAVPFARDRFACGGTSRRCCRWSAPTPSCTRVVAAGTRPGRSLQRLAIIPPCGTLSAISSRRVSKRRCDPNCGRLYAPSRPWSQAENARSNKQTSAPG
jgi:hypothetical protein